MTKLKKRKSMYLVETLIMIMIASMLVIVTTKFMLAVVNNNTLANHRLKVKEVHLIQELESAISNSSYISFIKEGDNQRVVFQNDNEILYGLELEVIGMQDNSTKTLVKSNVNKNIILTLEIDKTTGIVGYKVNDLQLYTKMEAIL